MAPPKLRIEPDVPYGNVAEVAVAEEGDKTEVAFAAHPHGGPESLWFCFRIANTGRGKGRQSLRLVLKHPGNVLGGSDLANMRPVVRVEGREWERLPEGAVEELPDGRRRVIWGIEYPATWAEVAYCYPYGPPDMETLIRETAGLWHAETIGVSQQGRPIARLSNDFGTKGGETPGLFLISRQHSGETPGSWVLDGFLRHLAGEGRAAPVVWAVPFANIDGVMQGDYGKDSFPYDVNRAWGAPPMRHETLVIQRDIGRWAARCKPALGIDFHAPGACEADGVYCYLPKPKAHPEQHRKAVEWASAIEQALTGNLAAEEFGRVADYKSRWETPNFVSYLCGQHDVCALTIETPYALIKGRGLTREDYREIGQRIASGVLGRLAPADERPASATG
jgi:hypothetical protein